MSRQLRQRPTDDALSLKGIRAIPTELAPARASLASYMHGLGLPAVQAQDAVLAGYEAMANSVEHAYPSGCAGTFDLHAARGHDGVVTVTVTDHGSWKDAGTQPHAKRGRGLQLMRACSDHAEVHRGHDGTRVRLQWGPRVAA
ncbi:anti-sigma factor [Prescottella equi]|uniref:ATP-binding protein n=1 Tax=Rhodococcus hoagii TaxID=43767 RepID=UPI0009BFC317|nr:ATP-binding protein [Prescottella equi]OQQ32087.1 anti-sigma factor [Prescottella equi]